MKFKLLLILLLPLGNAQASSKTSQSQCSEVDLRSEMGPIRDQGDKGWCYANAAADLLSFKHRQELHGQQVSAAYTALTYLRNIYGSIGDGGFVSGAVLASEEYGICPRTIEDRVEQTGLSKLTLKERLDALKQFKLDYDLASQDDPKAAKRFMDRYRQYINSKSMVAQMPYKILTNVLTNSTSRTFIDELGKNICSDQIKIPHEKYELVFDTKMASEPFDISLLNQKVHVPALEWNPISLNKDFIATINQQLSNNNIVAIDYFSHFLLTNFLKDPYTPQDGLHASVLVGRRWNSQSNSCEYLIRNSWGNQCNSYEVKQNCEAGNIWVPERVLRYNLYAYIFME